MKQNFYTEAIRTIINAFTKSNRYDVSYSFDTSTGVPLLVVTVNMGELDQDLMQKLDGFPLASGSEIENSFNMLFENNFMEILLNLFNMGYNVHENARFYGINGECLFKAVFVLVKNVEGS